MRSRLLQEAAHDAGQHSEPEPGCPKCYADPTGARDSRDAIQNAIDKGLLVVPTEVELSDD